MKIILRKFNVWNKNNLNLQNKVMFWVLVTHSFARRSWRARFLFWSCVLSSVQKMRIPVGLWIRSTAVSTLLTFCPVGQSWKGRCLQRYLFPFSFWRENESHGELIVWWWNVSPSFPVAYLQHLQILLLWVHILLDQSPPQLHQPSLHEA